MRRDLRVVLNTLTEYQIGFGNEFHIKNMAGYNIKSTAFRVAGLNQNVYISDIPNTNRTDGSLFLFTVPSSLKSITNSFLVPDMLDPNQLTIGT